MAKAEELNDAMLGQRTDTNCKQLSESVDAACVTCADEDMEHQSAKGAEDCHLDGQTADDGGQP